MRRQRGICTGMLKKASFLFPPSDKRHVADGRIALFTPTYCRPLLLVVTRVQSSYLK